jgi:hypothetical protein
MPPIQEGCISGHRICVFRPEGETLVSPYLKNDIFKLVENGDVEAFKKQRERVHILKDRDNRESWQDWFEGSYLHT